MFITTLLLFSFPFNSLADVKFLDKNEPAPFAGYLFSPDKEKEARIGLVEKDYYKQLTESQNRVIILNNDNEKIYTERLNLYRNQNAELQKELANQRSTSELQRWIYFGAGIFLSGFAVWGASRLHNR